MNWGSVILALLSLVGTLFNWARERQLLAAGAEAEIARQTMAILALTSQGQQLLMEVKAMHDEDLDKFLKDLGGA